LSVDERGSVVRGLRKDLGFRELLSRLPAFGLELHNPRTEDVAEIASVKETGLDHHNRSVFTYYRSVAPILEESLRPLGRHYGIVHVKRRTTRKVGTDTRMTLIGVVEKPPVPKDGPLDILCVGPESRINAEVLKKLSVVLERLRTRDPEVRVSAIGKRERILHEQEEREEKCKKSRDYCPYQHFHYVPPIKS
jgi:hypothetical protein